MVTTAFGGQCRKHAPDCSFCQVLITSPPTDSTILWHTAGTDEVPALLLNRRMRCLAVPPLSVGDDLLAISRPIVKPEQSATQLCQSGTRPRFNMVITATIAPPREAPPGTPGIDVRPT